MKSINLYVLLSVLIFSCDRTDHIDKLPCNYIDFKYYNDEPDPLGEMSGDYILFGSDSSNSDKSIRDYIKSKNYFNHYFDFEIYKLNRYKYKYGILKLSKTCSCDEITWILDDLEQNQVIDYAHFTIQTDDCTNLFWEPIGDLCVNSYSNIFYVKVKDTIDISDLNTTLLETNTWIREQNQFRHETYSIYADKSSKGDALEMANYFHETGLFEYSEPDIIKIVVE